ncbi:hypothetical protein WOLCODRAFT_128570 [Wolfiporia cocos MD-104 SS10]|uniref:DNA/RNA-binding domain-containing protein n=1 Tax=Wolfiporia cocos (strain MD-104) TaxID=742152 RepID=A0A2H3JII7_WOLCO|nr:hypothetical protein WOLCODRAFT_128570 [Wolfiporia cocos MD-104 SS10]
MSEEASQIAREAQGLHRNLKEPFKSRDPWDREVEFQRKNLRRQYLRLLFVHPYASESKDVETHLWMVTSYQFIAKYKDRLSALDRAIYGAPHQQQQQQQPPRAGQSRVVEYRKLLQRFRQFLSEEEKFWIQLIVRMQRVFALDDAQRVLATLSLVPDEAPAPAPADSPPARRAQHQFPPEADVVSPTAATATPAQRNSRVAVLSKALVCLGDIERYKEQYNEAGGRPRAGHEDGPPAAASITANTRGGRGRRGGAAPAAPPPVPRMRNYDKAQSCYEQARLLLPQDGNPSHQLAILASYQKDTFAGLYHYYRALCVRTPYEPALENMSSLLNRALEAWMAREANENDRERQDEIVPRVRVEKFKEKVIAVHACWRRLSSDMSTVLPQYSQRVIDDYRGLVSERVLPTEMIWKVVILSQAALWKHRMTRRPSVNGSGRRAPSTASAAMIESSIATHLLALYRVLLEVGVVEVAESPPEDVGEQDLAQSITATFRRTLPALRLLGKWLRANLKYILQAQPRENANVPDGSDSSEGREHGGRHRRRRSGGHPRVIDGLREFWAAYVQFANALMRTFPEDRLPMLSASFEEDVEMVGFRPLESSSSSDRTIGTSVLEGAAMGAGQGREGVHPNEEQLMRIGNLLADSRALATTQGTPIIMTDNRFALVEAALRPDPSRCSTRADTSLSNSNVEHTASPPLVPPSEPNGHAVTSPVEEDDTATISTRTDDDPVRDAFREALNGITSTDEEEEQEDEIVFNPRPIDSPPEVLRTPGPAASPVRPPMPISPVTNSPIARPLPPPSNNDRTPLVGTRPLGGATAADLLSGLQRSGAHSRTPSAPHSQWPFGSGSGHLGSIWSTDIGSSPLRLPNVSSRLPFPSQPLPPTQPPLPSSFSSHSSQHPVLDGGLPASTSQALDPYVGVGRSRSVSLNNGSSLSRLPVPRLEDYPNAYLPTSQPLNPAFSTGVPRAYADPVYPASRPDALARQPPGYQYQPMQHSHVHERRVGLGQDLHDALPPLQSFSQYPLSQHSQSQLWTNPG